MSSALDTVLEDIIAVQETYSRGVEAEGVFLTEGSLLDVKADWA